MAIRVLLLTDAAFARHERAMLARLEIGLAGEGVRTWFAVPDDARLVDAISSVGTELTYPAGGMAWTRSLRAAELIRRIGPNRNPDLPTLDIVHVFGGRAWRLGQQVARRTGAALILEVWRRGLVDRARSFRTREGPPTVFSGPEVSTERALIRETGSGSSVRLVPWGAHVTPAPTPLFREGKSIAITLIGAGRSRHAFIVAFNGIAELLKARSDMMLFVDADAAVRSAVWHAAGAAKVRDKVSLIDELEDRRDLVLRGDLLVLADSRGEQRSLLLDAMGAGMPVVAAADEHLGALIDGTTARVIEHPTTAKWTQTIGELIDAPAEARALGASAREWVRDNRRASTHVAAVIDLYEWITAEPAIPFRTAQG